MYYNLDVIFGALITIYGVILLTRRKFVIRQIYSNLFFPGFLILMQVIESIKTNSLSWILPIFICLLILLIITGRYRFILTNVDSQMVTPILTGILKGKNISYEKYKTR